MRYKIGILLVTILSLISFFNFSLAQGDSKVLDYGENLILDSDLDGLTDLGEKDIYKTDPLVPDSDIDGFYDGVEVVEDYNPLDNTSPVATKVITASASILENEVPWVWYISRATGILAFLLLYIVIFSGLIIRMPVFSKIMLPANSLKIHEWLSIQSLVFVFVHGGILLLDKYVNYRIEDILIPFYNGQNSKELAFGILAMYLMLLLIITSYIKKFIGYKIWRTVHFLNIILYVLVVWHALYLGTDLQTGIFRWIFIGINLALVILMAVNIATRIIKSFRNSN